MCRAESVSSTEEDQVGSDTALTSITAVRSRPTDSPHARQRKRFHSKSRTRPKILPLYVTDHRRRSHLDRAKGPTSSRGKPKTAGKSRAHNAAGRTTRQAQRSVPHQQLGVDSSTPSSRQSPLKPPLKMRVAWVLTLATATLAATIDAQAAHERFAISSVRMVEAPSRAEALNDCQSTSANAVSVGVDWGTGVNGGRVHLCQTRVAISDLQRSPQRVLQRVVATSGSACPSGLERLTAPRPGVIVCVAYASSDDQGVLSHGDFVSDLAVTSERNYNNDAPGWTTIPVSLHTVSGSTSPSNRGVFLSVRRPARPIIGLEAVSKVPTSDVVSACQQSLGEGWRSTGDASYLNTNATDVNTVLCLQSPPLQDDTSAQAKLITDLTLSKTSCADGFQQALLLADGITLCSQWAASSEPASWLADVVLHRVNAALGGESDPSTAEFLPGGFRIVANVNVNPSGPSPVYLFTRSWKPTPFQPPPVLTKPPLEAVVTLQQTLSYRILQIADLHFTGDPNKACRDAPAGVTRCNEALMTKWINDLLDAEKPDFVAFTGDNVETFTASRRQPALSAVTQGVEARGIPHGLVFGNHDDENGFPREELVRLASSKKYSYTQRGPTEIAGVGNYELGVHAPVDGVWGSKGTEVFRMYFLDSHGYPDRKKYPMVSSSYDWVKPNQIEFYKSLAQSHATQGNRVPAVMLFHIPLVEYAANAASKTKGEQYEAVASSDMSTNLFSTLVDLGEVKATFCGHDHVNDYCYKREGVQLCYGGGAGFGQSYGRSSFARRARVIEWSMNGTGQRTLRTWQRHFGDVQTRKNEQVLYQEL